MRNYLSDFLTPAAGENLATLKVGNPQNPQKGGRKSGDTSSEQPSKPSKAPLVVALPPFEGFEGSPTDMRADFSPNVTEPALMVTTSRICLYRQRYQPAVDPENIEMHDSALFDVVVEVDFYDGRRIRIPQTSTPEGWECPF